MTTIINLFFCSCHLTLILYKGIERFYIIVFLGYELIRGYPSVPNLTKLTKLTKLHKFAIINLYKDLNQITATKKDPLNNKLALLLTVTYKIE